MQRIGQLNDFLRFTKFRIRILKYNSQNIKNKRNYSEFEKLTSFENLSYSRFE